MKNPEDNLKNNFHLLPAIFSDFEHCIGWGGENINAFLKENKRFFKLQS